MERQKRRQVGKGEKAGGVWDGGSNEVGQWGKVRDDRLG